MAWLRVCVVCLALLLLLQWTGANHDDDGITEYRPGECLPGDKHKELACPEPEGPDYKECFQWRDETCCTAEFTEQLDTPRVTDVDGFRWDHCGNLSKRCHDYFVSMECFYRCSPNVAHWRNPNYTSAVLHLPVCREFCDEWYDACEADFTCATNWISDWLYVNEENLCLNSSSCRTFSDVYGSGKGLCEILWEPSFVYSNTSSSDPDRKCMTISWSMDQPSPNQVALNNIFGDAVNTVKPATCSGGRGASVWSALVTFVTVAVATLLL